MNYSNFAARLRQKARPSRRTYPEELLATMCELVTQHGLTATACVDELVATEDEYKAVSRTALRVALSRYMERTGKRRQRLKTPA
jgi:hypothetical protein